jgi:hypothetical protein
MNSPEMSEKRREERQKANYWHAYEVELRLWIQACAEQPCNFPCKVRFLPCPA